MTERVALVSRTNMMRLPDTRREILDFLRMIGAGLVRSVTREWILSVLSC